MDMDNDGSGIVAAAAALSQSQAKAELEEATSASTDVAQKQPAHSVHAELVVHMRTHASAQLHHSNAVLAHFDGREADLRALIAKDKDGRGIAAAHRAKNRQATIKLRTRGEAPLRTKSKKSQDVEPRHRPPGEPGSRGLLRFFWRGAASADAALSPTNATPVRRRPAVRGPRGGAPAEQRRVGGGARRGLARADRARCARGIYHS